MKKFFKRVFFTLCAICGLCLFLIAPGKGEKPDMQAFKGPFAHRGYFDNENGIPENSVPAFQNAIDNGCGIELDVQLSSDGVPVVFHDADLERVTGNTGKVWEYTARQLCEMHLLDTEYTICTLEYVMDIIDGQVPVIIEHKMDRVDTAVCEKTYEILQDYSGPWCMKSFDPRALLWYKSNAPQVIRGQLAEEFWHSEKFAGSPLYTALSFMVANVATRPDFVSYNYLHKDNIALKLCRLMGAQTACWTVKTQQDYDIAASEFDMVIFDSFQLHK